MQKISFFKIQRDTGANYNSFIAHYSSLDALKEGFQKNTDLINNLKSDVFYREWDNESRKKLSTIDDLTVDFKLKHMDGNSYQLYMTVGNLKLAYGHTEKTPEIKEIGMPYKPESSNFVVHGEKIESVDFILYIWKVELILDVVHCNYGKLKDFNGNDVEESEDPRFF